MSFVAPDDSSQPAFGLNVSGGGLSMLTRTPLQRAESRIELIAMIGGLRMAFEADLRWQQEITVRGVAEYRSGLKLVTIEDGDWNSLVALTLEDEGGGGIAEGSLLSAQQRDSMLPVDTQQRIAAKLVLMQRLAEAGDGRLPLIEYRFNGYRMKQGVPFYHLTVRSKTVGPDGASREFRSTVDAGIDSAAIVIA